MTDRRQQHLARIEFQAPIVERAKTMTRVEVVEWANTFRYMPKSTTKADALNCILAAEWAKHLSEQSR